MAKTEAPKAARTSGAGLSLAESRIAESKRGEGYKFDPTLIIAIISALIPLIANCFNPKPQALRRRFLNRARVAAAIRREQPGLSFQEAFDEADNLFDLADKATDEELQLLINDCCAS